MGSSPAYAYVHAKDERPESARVRAEAFEAKARVVDAVLLIRRLNAIYRERLEGRRG